MSDHPKLPADSYAAFFAALYGHPPFRWQIRLAERACRGDWPRFIKLPTASGKTSCLDIAVFALAHQACRRQAIDAPRRIFFVVDRRIIVNEAFQRAERLADRLKAAVTDVSSPLYPVAWWLQKLTGNQHAPPLDCVELRGGIYRDDAWVRSLLQPTIITSTVDQVGSRLLFRGYGVSDRNLPIHAALTANDSLILLDEAHCSKPFSQTMAAIARYRDAGLNADAIARWAEQPIRTPFRFIEMTATPQKNVDEAELFQLEEADYQNDQPLENRHGCAKPIRLDESKAKGSNQNLALAKDLVKHAEALAEGNDGQTPCLRIAIVVNRVECARHAFDLLKGKHGDRVELMIGRMRPIDREGLTRTLQDRFKSGSEASLTEPHFVVATQCLEVGADFDFDGMVCQCASLDALRQRFGRLNRLGKTRHARGVIIMAEGDKSPRKPDPIYGESLPATWEWLREQSSDNITDFGIRALDAALTQAGAAINGLSAEAPDAPVLMPAHLDMLCQTSPRPALEPEIAHYLHGPNRGMPEVRICWRADLPICPPGKDSEWTEACRQTLAVCPPTSSECLSVPLTQFKAWLRGDEDDHSEDSGDLLGQDVSDDDEATANSKAKKRFLPQRRGVTWNGRECRPASGAKDELDEVRPQSLVVLPATAGGWSTLGHVPGAPPEPEFADGNTGANLSEEQLQSLSLIDVATKAFPQRRNRLILRVHRRLLTSAADSVALTGLQDYLDDSNLAWRHDVLAVDDEIRSEVAAAIAALDDTQKQNRSSDLLDLRQKLFRLEDASKADKKQTTMIRYPDGFVIIGPRNSRREQLPRASFDDDFDEQNLDADERISLADHLADVAAETERLASNIGMNPGLASALVAAAERHDLGKADLRFQALLLGSPLDVAAMQPKLWAKSDRGAATRRNASEPSSRGTNVDRLPVGFRHEMLSLELVQRIHHELNDESYELMLHAISAHHGHARPLAPVVVDDSPPDVDLGRLFPRDVAELDVKLTGEQRRQLPPHRLDSGVSERFWKLNRRFGWWGLAWLETVLRLADWVASAQPVNAPFKPRVLASAIAVPPSSSTKAHCLNCIGLNGANPLGFLAALGLFQHISTSLDSTVRMRWEIAGGNWSPTLIGSHPVIADEASLLDWLFTSLRTEPSQHPLKRLNELPQESLALSISSEYSRAADEAQWYDRITADWLSCNGSDLCGASNNNQLQTARRDYFPESVAAIISALARDHLERTLFRQWDYADPIQKVSLHLEPREDRRHAYQWHKPVGDPTRSLHGGMVGANRLAMEAWPLFQSVPRRGELQTVGFKGTRPMKGIRWTWPIWTVPITLSGITPLLNLERLQLDPDQQSFDASEALRGRGIQAVFSLRRILVEKTPNFTLPIAVFTGSIQASRTP